MKNKSFALLVSFTLFLGACSSDDPEPQDTAFFIRFKIDGVLVDYPTTALHPAIFNYDASGAIYNAIVIVPKQGSDGTKDFFSITTRNETAFEIGKTYEMQDPITYSSVAMSRILMTWANPEGEVFNAVLLKSGYPSLDLKNDARIRFSEIGESVIRGTFSGIITGPALSSNPLSKVLEVTEGEFKLNLVRN